MSAHRRSDRTGDPVSAGIWELLMKRIIRWLKSLFSRPSVTAVADQSTKSLTVKSDDIAEDKLESEKIELMPDIYADRHVATEPDPENPDQSLSDIDKSAGFNPYDTAVLRKKLGPKPR